MTSRVTCFLTLVLVSAFLVGSTDARSWDIAVAIGQEIDFFAQNGMHMGQSKVADAKILMGLAYDSVTRTIYVSDKDNDDVSMYNSCLTDKDPKSHTMLNQTNGDKIISIAFDPVNRTLFWTDGRHHAIKKMQAPLAGNPGPPEVLHDLKGLDPYGIALDICNRFIYWSNCRELNACSIERSKLDGSDREIIIDRDLYDVYGLAVDHSAGKLYWVDDVQGFGYNIERSDLNGAERELFVSGTHHEPAYVAVDNEAVYWTDRQSEAVWKMKKNKGIEDGPTEFKSYYVSHPQSRVMSIITRDNVGDMDCEAVLRGQKRRLEHSATPDPLVESFNDLPTRNIHLQCTCNSGGYFMPLVHLHTD